LIVTAIRKLVERLDLTYEEAQDVLREVMSGRATNAQIASFLTALRMKGETVDEIAACATVMRKFCRAIHPQVNDRLVDTCGTGGGRAKTFNISTAATFVAAGAGVRIAKHGNRSFTTSCGSADVMESLGFDLDAAPSLVETAIEQVGVGFIYAPAFHPAMRHAIGPRREMAIRTIFNILGPLTNPANANAQLLGVYDEGLVQSLARVLRKLNCEAAMIVHGRDGLDEFSNIGATTVAWLKEGTIESAVYSPSDFGLKTARASELLPGATTEEGAELCFRIVKGVEPQGSAVRDVVTLNAAASIILGGVTASFREGLNLACEAIESGAAYTKLRRLVKTCNGDLSNLEGLERKYG
jgi:anthranilate phosphoribosyltransferase